MKVDVTNGDGLRKRVNVEIPADQVRQRMDQKFTEVRKEAEIKGFRKGKVPMDRIKSMFGDQVKADVVEELIRTTYPDAVRDSDLTVASPPTVTAVDFSDDGDFQYTAEVEVFPEIDKIDYDGLKVTLPKVEVSDAEVDEFIDAMRKRFADQRPVERPAQKEDVVLADVVKVEDSKGLIEEDEFADQQIDLDNTNTLPAFREHLPGKKAGEEVEIEVDYPEDYQDERFAGAHMKYRVKIKEVQERLVPEFDDTFAKNTGQAETALEMRLKVRQELEERIQREQERQKRGQIIEQLCKKNEIPVPEAFVDRYIENVTEDFKKRYKDVSEDDIRQNYRDVGEKTVRWNLLYNRLADMENIEVLPSDTENRIKRFAEHYQMSMDQAKMAMQQAGSADEIKDSILEEKVLAFLSEKTDVSYVEPEQKK